MNLLALRYKRFHPSHVLGWYAVGLLAGLGLSQVVLVQTSSVVTMSLWISVLISLVSRRWWAVMVGIFSLLLIGIIHGSVWKIEIGGYEDFRGKTIQVEGIVADDPEMNKQKKTQFSVGSVIADGRRMPGSMYVSVGADTPSLRRGDTVMLRGVVADPFGRYQATLRDAEVAAVSKSDDALLDIRDTFSEQVRQYVSEPAASLGLGFVVGQRSQLPEELDEQLRIVGLTHIVVASGYNLTILIRLARRIFDRHSKYLAFASSMGLMILFVAVSGMTPSMVRASAVTGLSLLAWYYGRRFHPVLIILYVAAVTAYISPIYVWYDIGWYLSFLAFAGVLLLAPLVGSWYGQMIKHEPSVFAKVVIETVSAQILTLPIILFVFGDLPVLSVLSNAMVAPVIPLAMLLTFVAGVAGAVFTPVAVLVGGMATIVIGYVLAVVTVLAMPEWAQQEFSISVPVMAAAFVAMTVAIIWGSRRLKYNYRSSSVIE